MNNEQRAHDFAIMLTNFYLNNPNKINDDIGFTIDFDKGLLATPYELYNKIYSNVSKYIENDFKD